jgi:hypothetical protein
VEPLIQSAAAFLTCRLIIDDMPEIRYLPRKLSLDALIRVLVKEHTVMKEGLRRMKEAADRKDFKDVSKALKQLDPVFRQHVADEEAQILRLLVGELGRKGADEEIRVFQQHRPIYRLMQTIAELAPKKAADLEAEQAKLGELFDDHTRAEEQRVFPKALDCYGRRDLRTR